MLIWKPPALLIVGINMGIFGALMFVFATTLEIIQPGDAAGGVFFCATGIGISVSDIMYRRRQELSLGSLEISTLFFVIPTWVAGIAVFVLGLSYLT